MIHVMRKSLETVREAASTTMRQLRDVVDDSDADMSDWSGRTPNPGTYRVAADHPHSARSSVVEIVEARDQALESTKLKLLNRLKKSDASQLI